VQTELVVEKETFTGFCVLVFLGSRYFLCVCASCGAYYHEDKKMKKRNEGNNEHDLWGHAAYPIRGERHHVTEL